MCVYQFYGPKPYIDKLREVIDSLKTSGLYIQVVTVYVGVSNNIFILVRKVYTWRVGVAELHACVRVQEGSG